MIDRKDGVVNVCKMKFGKGEYSIGASYARELENKLALLKEETETSKSLHLTFVTASGVKRSENTSCSLRLDLMTYFGRYNSEEVDFLISFTPLSNYFRNSSFTPLRGTREK